MKMKCLAHGHNTASLITIRNFLVITKNFLVVARNSVVITRNVLVITRNFLVITRNSFISFCLTPSDLKVGGIESKGSDYSAGGVNGQI